VNGSDLPFDGADEAWLPARSLEDRPQEVRGRRLPVRPRDARELELFRRLAEEHVCGYGHGLAGRRDDELRDIHVQDPLHDQRRRAALDRLPREIVAVDPLTADAEEQRTGRHLPRVVREVADLHGPARGHLAGRERTDQVIDLHAKRLEKPRAEARGGTGVRHCCASRRMSAEMAPILQQGTRDSCGHDDSARCPEPPGGLPSHLSGGV
jgi:hypothetical protein